MARLNTIALPQAKLNINPYQAAIFKPEVPDVNILARSLDRAEQRFNMANDKISAMDVAFSQMREKLHNDPETMAWFNDYSNKYKDRVNELAQQGRYGETIVAAGRYAAEAVNDPELQARVRSNEEYETWKKQVQASKASDLTKERWLVQNPYSFEATRDETGNITGGRSWESTINGAVLPSESYTVEQIQALADKFAAENRFSTEGGVMSGFDANGNPTTDISKMVGTRKDSSGKVVIEKPYDKLKSAVDNLLKQNPALRISLQQDYDDILYRIDQLTKQRDAAQTDEEREKYQSLLDQENSLVKPNGNLMSPQEYIESTIYPQLKNMQYRYTTTKSDNSFSIPTKSSISDDEPTEEQKRIIDRWNNTGRTSPRVARENTLSSEGVWGGYIPDIENPTYGGEIMNSAYE